MKQIAPPQKANNKGKELAKKSQGNRTQSRPINASIDHILHLQQTVGNQAVQRMIKSGALQLDGGWMQKGDPYGREIELLTQRVKSNSDPVEPKPSSDVNQRNINSNRHPLSDKTSLIADENIKNNTRQVIQSYMLKNEPFEENNDYAKAVIDYRLNNNPIYYNLGYKIGNSDSIYEGNNATGHSEEKILDAELGTDIKNKNTMAEKIKELEGKKKLGIDIYTEKAPCGKTWIEKTGDSGQKVREEWNCKELLNEALKESSIVYTSNIGNIKEHAMKYQKK